MKHSLYTGVSFGLTSAVITTLGLMVGLHSGTHSRGVVLGGILTIAIADALGIHVSEESENKHTTQEIWASTASAFLAKFLFALTFAVPVLLLPLASAILVSLVWGLTVLAVLSALMAKAQGDPPWKSVTEHLFIGVVVIVITHWVGQWIATLSQ